jgi:SAM-dependent methyltransferase
MEWYECWFDTKYYHILYKNRDYNEASLFIDKLIDKLNLRKDSEILDLACGKGRHSIYLNKKGFKVKGVDLSKQSIEAAKIHENENLTFEVADMRKPCSYSFDAVFNLFTSFGYFEDEEDDFKIIKNIKNSLKDSNSIAVIDFINEYKAVNNSMGRETKEIDGIKFNIEKSFDDNSIVKNIKFTDCGKNFDYIEKVKRISLDNFKNYFEKCGLKLIDVYGSYDLKEFDLENSDRLILIFKK